MPVDPQTGQALPYPGEPGYDPAMAGPPGAPPAGGPPMPPGPEQVMEAEGQEAGMRVEQIAAMAPQPEKPYSKKAVEKLTKEFNEAVESLGGGALPEIVVNLDSEKGAKWNLPLPPELFVPLYALSEALNMLPAPELSEKYAYDAVSLVDDPALRKMSGQLSKMSKDKKLIEVMSQPMGQEPAGDTLPPPQPGAMGEDDEMLAAGLE